ncbi:LysM peptidoglycan-binding domain-containing protein [Sporomusa sphaeroides]|uniref:LysM peptidoglycan-binding domain-containing protein n=1 Tax=Sporomusa sphaeroides TaxID=47679 RepID=UPI00202F05BE|nr:LysM peptidoglycan-binding domain-containing protein [Sporomusa sphaeroides]MCM0757411.1 LysM peptidoglycan-binding domain-containing protein [Sporomusa sphaeroides DSM 2875]HML33805.1 LysM peptidoglycan-binding domain-containing protein [Sporomusa sphaeroides]
MRKKRYFKIAVMAWMVIVLAVSCGNINEPEPPGKLVTEIYIVQHGDVLWDIAATYMDKNTYGPREIREFYHGIIELNSETVFAGRVPGLILPGDRLQINYWVKE